MQVDALQAGRQLPLPSLSWKLAAQVEQVAPPCPIAHEQVAVPLLSAHVPWPEQVLVVHACAQLPLPSLS